MTRINLVEPRLLTDQHLWAEHRELPRIFTYVEKYGLPKDLPKDFTLGKGHMKFFSNKLKCLINRAVAIEAELIRRGKPIIYPFQSLEGRFNELDFYGCKGHPQNHFWFPTNAEILISWQRIMERISKRPEFYTYYGKKIFKKND